MTSVLLEGPLTIERVAGLQAEWQGALEGHDGAIALDLHGVDEFDGAGLQLLLALARAAAEAGAALSLQRVPQRLAATLARFGAAHRFTMTEAP